MAEALSSGQVWIITAATGLTTAAESPWGWNLYTTDWAESRGAPRRITASTRAASTILGSSKMSTSQP